MRSTLTGLMSAVVLSTMVAGHAHAAANLIINGSFESTTGSLSNGSGGSVASQVGPSNLPGWTTAGGGNSYVELFTPGSADTTGAYYANGNNYLKLYGPGDGYNNGLPSTSPDGGNYLASDGDASTGLTGPLSQTVNGLTVGASYLLSFYWAGAQQYGYSGSTTHDWQVTFGGAPAQTTQVLSIGSGGFTGWQTATMTFKATSVSQTLSFLAVGTPSGAPPFSLLDGVSLTAVPEPATWGVLAAGLAGVAFVGRRRRRSGADAAA